MQIKIHLAQKTPRDKEPPDNWGLEITTRARQNGTEPRIIDWSQPCVVTMTPVVLDQDTPETWSHRCLPRDSLDGKTEPPPPPCRPSGAAAVCATPRVPHPELSVIKAFEKELLSWPICNGSVEDSELTSGNRSNHTESALVTLASEEELDGLALMGNFAFINSGFGASLFSWD
ncbi:hypothetical protein DUI87_25149 [Hirundo rustica rustica]|uniref:Uncharacterized protein n=1 Tax=Hirundo rustica rustica TaxID=333673 RepID=A0A3M0JTM3_HIRRU|nr:hypothetical protein DUI87_25149 [Hirundo rustica rustica]